MIMVVNTLTKFWVTILQKTALFTKAPVLTHLNKTAWQNEKNRHLLDVAKAISFTTKVSKYLGGDAILTTTFSIN